MVRATLMSECRHRVVGVVAAVDFDGESDPMKSTNNGFRIVVAAVDLDGESDKSIFYFFYRL